MSFTSITSIKTSADEATLRRDAGLELGAMAATAAYVASLTSPNQAAAVYRAAYALRTAQVDAGDLEVRLLEALSTVASALELVWAARDQDISSFVVERLDSLYERGLWVLRASREATYA